MSTDFGKIIIIQRIGKPNKVPATLPNPIIISPLESLIKNNIFNCFWPFEVKITLELTHST